MGVSSCKAAQACTSVGCKVKEQSQEVSSTDRVEADEFAAKPVLKGDFIKVETAAKTLRAQFTDDEAGLEVALIKLGLRSGVAICFLKR